MDIPGIQTPVEDTTGTETPLAYPFGDVTYEQPAGGLSESDMKYFGPTP